MVAKLNECMRFSFFPPFVTHDLLTSPPTQIAQKYDLQKEEELRLWIQEVIGRPIGSDFQKELKNGVVLCE